MIPEDFKRLVCRTLLRPRTGALRRRRLPMASAGFKAAEQRLFLKTRPKPKE
jgi:hypothetical protein